MSCILIKYQVMQLKPDKELPRIQNENGLLLLVKSVAGSCSQWKTADRCPMSDGHLNFLES